MAAPPRHGQMRPPCETLSQSTMQVSRPPPEGSESTGQRGHGKPRVGNRGTRGELCPASWPDAATARDAAASDHGGGSSGPNHWRARHETSCLQSKVAAIVSSIGGEFDRLRTLCSRGSITGPLPYIEMKSSAHVDFVVLCAFFLTIGKLG